MKSLYVKDLEKSTARTVTSSFVVIDKYCRRTNRGKPYLSLVLADRTGQVEARVWNNAEHAIGCFEAGNIIEIIATIEYYKDTVQLTVGRLRRCDPSGLDLSDYPPETTGMPDDFATLKEFRSAVGEWLSCDRSVAAQLATEAKTEELKRRYLGAGQTPTSKPATNKKHRPSRAPALAAKLEELKRKYLGAGQETDDF
ncbi:MAG: OB-fold nucleic acid binding domain-containing protein [Candidatus Korobacteraceae bacterium]|jgi:OB-fold nucleic acid binding protein